MSDQYFYRTLGMEFGPVSLAAIRELLQQGTLGAGDLLREQGGSWSDIAVLIHDGASHSEAKDEIRKVATPAPQTNTGQETRREPRRPDIERGAKRSKPPVPTMGQRPSDSAAIGAAGSALPPRSPETSTTHARWTCQTAQGVIGPIDTEQFLEAVQNGSVVRQTLVRLADSDPWMAAAEIAGLEFPGDVPTDVNVSSPESSTTAPQLARNQEMRRVFAECVDRQRSKAPPPPRVRLRPAGPGLITRLARALNPVFSYLSETLSSICESVLLLLIRIFRSRIVWGTTIVLLVILVSPQLIPKGSLSLAEQKQINASLAGIFAELKELRSKKADPSTWKEFQERSEEKLAAFLPKLERYSRSGDVVSMSLLRATRDYFPILLKAPMGSNSGTEEKLRSHFWALDYSFQHPTVSSKKWDVAMVMFIGLDLLAACAALGYFGRHWWLRRGATR